MVTNVVSALGAGSGIDIQQLATDLVSATREPQEARLQERIDAGNARISGYSAIRYSLATLKAAFADLSDVSDFGTLSTAVSQPAAISVSTTTDASTASVQLEVTQLAQAQVTASGGFATTSESLNGGAAFTLDFSLNGGTATSIAVTDATPQGVVDAINSATDGSGDALGVTAQLVNTGDANTPYAVVITGQEGAEQSFTLTSSSADVTFGDPVRDALDAAFTLNGLPMTRASNVLDDVIDGVTFTLNTVTSGAARVDLVRDKEALRSKVEDLVLIFNDTLNALDVLSDAKSEDPDYGGVLAGESYVNTLRNQLRRMITDTSSTPGESLTAARDLGLSFDKDGVLTLDADAFDAAAEDHFEDIVTLFSANTEDQSVYSQAAGGVAGDAVIALDKMLRTTGIIAMRESTQNSQVARYEDQLARLADQMDRLLEYYIKQFSVMDNIVGRSSAMRDELKTTFEGMAAMYKNN